MLKLVYFAWVRERTGTAGEEIELPAEVATVADLIAWQKARGGGFAEAFTDHATIRAAVNQEHADLQQPLKPGDEVAFFPPVTGG